MRDAFCSHCGTAYADTSRYPRRCVACGVQIWANPTPVAVVLLPVRAGERLGLLVVQRAIEPGLGKLALVGGFLEEHETWQEGAARELREETGVVIDPRTLSPFGFSSTAPRPNRVLLFALAAPVAASELGAFRPDAETAGRGLVFGPRGLDDVFAFSLHVDAARRFFEGAAIDGEHAHAPV